MLKDQIVVKASNGDETYTAETVTYEKYSAEVNRAIYVSDLSQLHAQDKLYVTRSFPKPTATFNGVAKTSIKLVREMEVPQPLGSKVCPCIIEVNFSRPAGVDDESFARLRELLVSLLHNGHDVSNGTLISDINDKMMV